jgi:hypothetical protein
MPRWSAAQERGVQERGVQGGVSVNLGPAESFGDPLLAGEQDGLVGVVG